MYLSHFGLQKKPFDISPDPSFLWLGDKHREALSYLQYGIMESKGFLMMTGDVGTGKTALIRLLMRLVDTDTYVVTVPDPDLSPLDFFNFIANELSMDCTFESKGEFLMHFKQFLKDAYAEQRKVLLIIDEAHRLKHALLEEIRLLSNVNLGRQVVLNTFFIGQPEFNQMLMQGPNRALRQRIRASFHLDPLNADEVRSYVAHRLRVAGASRQVFTEMAIRRVFEYTSGYPRLINILCDRALMTGYTTGANAILPSMLDECFGELSVAFGGNVPAAVTRAQPDPEPDSESTAAVVKQVALPAVETKKSILRPLALALAVFLMLAAVAYFAYGPVSDSVADASQTESAAPVSATVEGHSFAADDTPGTSEVPTAYRSTGENKATVTKTATVSSEAPSQAPANGDDGQLVADGTKRAVIFFELDSPELPTGAAAELVRLAISAFRFPDSEISILGYTDAQGNEWYNRKLSQTRADMVRDFFIERGIHSRQISAIGKGAENPIETNDTNLGRKRNRRVEIEVRLPSAG